MKIVLARNSTLTPSELAYQIGLMFESSRFTLEAESISARTVKVANVRLRRTKPYCGNHPNACEFNTGAKHRRHHYLEGADWVEFNDLLNDVLDAKEVVARVFSTVCVLREGRARRINYGSVRIGNGFRDFWQWKAKGSPEDYADYVGRVAPPSKFPYGTPGEYSRIHYAMVG